MFVKKSFQSKEYGDYLQAVEDFITKHSLLESQIATINQHLKSLNRRAQQFTRDAAYSSVGTVADQANSPPPRLQPSSATSSTSNFSGTTSTSTSSPESFSPSGESSTTPSAVVVESESQLVRQKLEALNKAFDLITVLGAERRKYLEERRDYHK